MVIHGYTWFSEKIFDWLKGVKQASSKLYILLGIYNKTPVRVTVLHGRFQHGAEMFSEMAQERLNVAKIEINRISPVLSVHTGPGIVGAAVVPMKLMEDLI